MPTARELRQQVRWWRRGRADAKLGEAIQDAYVGLFAAVMLGAILINVLIGLGDIGRDSCTAAACQGARAAAPLVVALGALGLVVSLARLVGPVFVSPAVGAWLASTPVDRGGLLRPRALVGGVVGAAVVGLVTAAAATLSGWPIGAAAVLVGAAALLALAALGVAVRAQTTRWSRRARAVSRVPGALSWLLMLAVATGLTAGSQVGALHPAWYVALLAAAALAAAGLAVALRAVARLHRADVARSGALVPAISGALATLDLSLAWDVVTDHQWRGRAAVRSRRGRWNGLGAVVWADVARLRRSPGRVLRLAAAGVVPVAAHAAGVGVVNVLVVALVGFVAGLPLLSSLRVFERSPGLTRMLPFPTRVARSAATVVPVLCLVVFGLALSPVLTAHGPTPADVRPLLGLAAGICATAAGVRWMTGRPPDYGKPLVSTPAGGVPTNLYGSIARGIDVLLLTVAPMLLSPTPKGALWSIGLCAAVLAYLLGRD